jgi:hypothetical protein
MIPAKRIGVLLAAAWSTGGSCGATCPPVMRPQPMTENRAREIDPTVTTGVAFSTTYVFGDCRKDQPQTATDKCGTTFNPACVKERRPLRVFVLPVNTSVPVSERCPGAFAVEDLARIAVLDARASEGGEIVDAVAAGRHTVEVSSDDRCAACGLTDGGMGCLVDVTEGRLTIRDLVLDESAH